MKVRNVEKDGRAVQNQFIIEPGDGAIYFQSYDTMIAKKEAGPDGPKITLDADKWDYSRTTGKYRNMFLREDKKETQRKIDSGEYALEDLNS